MLEDRDNMRRSPRFKLKWSATVMIIALNIAVFVFQNLVDYRSDFSIYNNFALSVDGLKHGHLWQLVTFQFLHLPLDQGGIFHLFGNLFVIWLFGVSLEQRIGRLKFIELYLLSGTVGGLLQMAGGLLSPEHFGNAVVGASAGAFGIMAAFATFFPGRNVHMFFLPFAIRADFLMSFAVVATLLGLFLPSGHMAHCAHLGGIFCGFIFARKLVRLDEQRPVAVIAAGNLLQTAQRPNHFR
jgi:membrane associated rhomboid family serine protease